MAMADLQNSWGGSNHQPSLDAPTLPTETCAAPHVTSELSDRSTLLPGDCKPCKGTTVEREEARRTGSVRACTPKPCSAVLSEDTS